MIYLECCKHKLVKSHRTTEYGYRASGLVGDLQSVDDTRDVAQYGQENVDEEVGVATPLKEDTKRWEEDGEDDFADVAIGSEQSATSSMS